MSLKILSIVVVLILSFALFKLISDSGVAAQPSAKLEKPTKLMFIHHSVGGHWLAHDQGGLVNELNKRSIYVNDITYGWEPSFLTDGVFRKVKRKVLQLLRQDKSGPYDIGSRTDIGHWYEWFVGEHADEIMTAVYTENRETDTFGDHSNATSVAPLENPGVNVPNEIIMFKSCYPNSLLNGKPDDPPNESLKPPRNFVPGSEEHTIANAKRIYNDILKYFGAHPGKFFVVITAPPRNDLPEEGRIARGFNNWLYSDWLKENNYSLKNVFVFDFFNVLTSGVSWEKNDLNMKTGNHHRLWQGSEQHTVNDKYHKLVYPRDGKQDNHPSAAGLQKAAKEFVPLLLQNYDHWKASLDN